MHIFTHPVPALVATVPANPATHHVACLMLSLGPEGADLGERSETNMLSSTFHHEQGSVSVVDVVAGSY